MNNIAIHAIFIFPWPDDFIYLFLFIKWPNTFSVIERNKLSLNKQTKTHLYFKTIKKNLSNNLNQNINLNMFF